ncbi:MAG TPA: SRPBCC domain-containing protein [Spongiibacteraceae bacterium]|nr:SRPBCC domain-containing protein [Spongiibacteraceae bacterium]
MSTAAGTADTAAVVSTKVEINAPAQLVWDVLVDFKNYGAWNPFNPRVEADLKIGGAITMEIVMADPNAQNSMTEYFCLISPPGRLSWDMVTSQDGDKVTHDHYIDSIDAQRCTYHHSDTFVGPAAKGTVSQFGEGIKMAFDSVAQALKVRAESLYKN